VATIDYTPYLCVPAAIEFREKICGGEGAIRDYCYELARVGGKRVADILGTEVMKNKSGSFSQCYFANVKLPFTIREHNELSDTDPADSIGPADVGSLLLWLRDTAVTELDTYLQMAYHSGYMWIRLSGQIYLELNDFEWVGPKLKELCDRGRKGEFKHKGVLTSVQPMIELESIATLS
jgi:hypothetical protein